ncbi:hypothetical protein VTL71DRAFT_4786 [Oculimacula yallundae]|uniref:Uncharacterized protein n=1 Tax=Oculimacula yallundae TaxID=86028 RepID=A0ABR4C449_9HELO
MLKPGSSLKPCPDRFLFLFKNDSIKRTTTSNGCVMVKSLCNLGVVIFARIKATLPSIESPCSMMLPSLVPPPSLQLHPAQNSMKSTVHLACANQHSPIRP